MLVLVERLEGKPGLQNRDDGREQPKLARTMDRRRQKGVKVKRDVRSSGKRKENILAETFKEGQKREDELTGTTKDCFDSWVRRCDEAELARSKRVSLRKDSSSALKGTRHLGNQRRERQM